MRLTSAKAKPLSSTVTVRVRMNSAFPNEIIHALLGQNCAEPRRHNVRPAATGQLSQIGYRPLTRTGDGWRLKGSFPGQRQSKNFAENCHPAKVAVLLP